MLAYSISVAGPKFADNESALLYLWRESGAYFTLALPVAPGTPRTICVPFGESGPVIPAGEPLCFPWDFSNLSTPRWVFADCLYRLLP